MSSANVTPASRARRLAKRTRQVNAEQGARRRWSALNSVGAELKHMSGAQLDAAIVRLNELAAEFNRINAEGVSR